MPLLGTLGLVLVALAAAAFLAEQRGAALQGRRMRMRFVVPDVVGGLLGLVVAAIAFTA